MKGLVITTENKMQVREFNEPAYETIGKAVGGWICTSFTSSLSSVGVNLATCIGTSSLPLVQSY